MHHYDISKLSSKRFLYIFNRTILTVLDKTDEYKESITQSRSSSNRGYALNMDKLRDEMDEEAKPDFLDLDKDGNKELMKAAVSKQMAGQYGEKRW
jgi:hypothetical protein